MNWTRREFLSTGAILASAAAMPGLEPGASRAISGAVLAGSITFLRAWDQQPARARPLPATTPL